MKQKELKTCKDCLYYPVSKEFFNTNCLYGYPQQYDMRKGCPHKKRIIWLRNPSWGAHIIHPIIYQDKKVKQ